MTSSTLTLIETTLRIIRATPSAEALHRGKVTVIMKKIGTEWKQAGDLN